MEHFEVFGEVVNGTIELSDVQQVQLAQGTKSWPDGQIAIEVRRERKSVSAKQRGYWHAVVVPMVAEYTGDDVESTHEDLKNELFPMLGLPRSITKRWKSKKTGRWRQRTTRRSLSDLNSKYMTDLIDLVRKRAAEISNGALDIPAPDPNWRAKRTAA